MYDATKNKFRNITFQQVNIDEQQDIAAKYGVRGIPHLVMLDGGGNVLYNGGAFENVDGFSQKIESYR